ncbi:aminopeptidase N [Oleiphilus sp. HI0118]|uniref:aminopeptidase N n=2 Tax=Oleiphilus sp. HI0079 TaxID=1822254 RepID=UPI0007C2CF79|nr:aminopeptidase N [Oleiphilus sp. HI0079]KZZ14560.1 aminopeptidase N [Oleiphilus sp. HI0079]KZZ44836.1 aminopeptidase N [Oleiphilus sp. HI0118]
MKDAAATVTYLKDYQVPAFCIESVHLTFRLYEDGAEVTNVMRVLRKDKKDQSALRLDGEELQLRSIKLDGSSLDESSYTLNESELVIDGLRSDHTLEVVTWIKPQDNKRLEGLYKSSTMFCTQCEAEGFRRITYYLDRPDVLSIFTTRVEADQKLYPNLLSNGNLVDSGELGEGRHFAEWNDPFPKPSYLFALVAGDLHCQRDSFTTMSGKEVRLEIFVEHKNATKCDYALDALKRSMRWDEEVYGREYDLDIFMIVAVDDFNMGAMENKGLNIFNSSCVLAKPETTTDNAYQRIEAIVAHEYFHNWSGNRVTCRDWFQLSLKEGFTVFRDSEFSADTNSRVVKRIEDVTLLRTAQFAEDAGPMSHPVRPASYMEISNFYTLTVYEKGAEVVRMLHTLLGPDDFRKGSDLYFDRHDGQAVTTDDFVAAMEDVSGRDLTQFKRWYSQSGTPEVTVSSTYDPKMQTYTLHFKQTCPATPQQPEKAPFLIPIELGLLDESGQDIPLSCFGNETSAVFELSGEEESLVFEGVTSEPTPSLLRGFSAPVKLYYDYASSQLLFLTENDSDGFNRWDASQKIAVNELQRMTKAIADKEPAQLSSAFVEAVRKIVRNEQLDKAMVCKLMQLPSASYLIELSSEADVDSICRARDLARKQLSFALHSELYECYSRNVAGEQGGLSYVDMSRRALKNVCLGMLSANADEDFIALCRKQYSEAGNMTDQLGALAAMIASGNKQDAEDLLLRFYDQWRDDAQVVELWFSVQSASSEFADLSRIKSLMEHEAFDFLNPNKLRSVVGAFAGQNLKHFHALDGEAYAFLADQIIKLDDQNPQIASRLATPLTRWRKFSVARQTLMTEQLQRIHGKESLSKDLREIVEKSLP